MEEPVLLSAIHDIALWTSNRDGVPDEVDEALSLIVSICRHGGPVWSDEEATKYKIAKLSD